MRTSNILFRDFVAESLLVSYHSSMFCINLSFENSFWLPWFGPEHISLQNIRWTVIQTWMLRYLCITYHHRGGSFWINETLAEVDNSDTIYHVGWYAPEQKHQLDEELEKKMDRQETRTTRAGTGRLGKDVGVLITIHPKCVNMCTDTNAPKPPMISRHPKGGMGKLFFQNAPNIHSSSMLDQNIAKCQRHTLYFHENIGH